MCALCKCYNDARNYTQTGCASQVIAITLRSTKYIFPKMKNGVMTHSALERLDFISNFKGPPKRLIYSIVTLKSTVPNVVTYMYLTNRHLRYAMYTS